MPATDSMPDRSRDVQPLITYFALTFALAWTVWIVAAIFVPNAPGWVLVGAWAPTVSALAVTWRSEGRVGVRRLLGSVVRWRVAPSYWAFAILGMLGVALLSLGAYALLGGTVPGIGTIAARFGLPADRPLLFLAVAPVVYLTTIFVGGPIAEELGWRGFAQPRLQERLGAGNAGLLIGLVWSLWHLPLFVVFPAAVGHVPLAAYIPLVTAFGVLFAWLYVRCRGSVLLCILFHASINFSLGVMGGEALRARVGLMVIFLVLVTLLAAALYLRLRTHGAVSGTAAELRR